MKQVAKAESDLEIADARDRLKDDNLIFDINEFDDYALETGLQIKESIGGDVTILTVGPERASEILHVGLAKGADRAIHIKEDALGDAEPAVRSRLIAGMIKNLRLNYDLILTGVETTDDGSGQVGVSLAERLGWPHATVVTKLEMLEGGRKARISREIGGGVLQIMEVRLPAVFTIQLGIYKLRYASMRGIAKARTKETKTLTLNEIKLTPSEIGLTNPKIRIIELAYPPKGEGAQIIEGQPKEAAKKLVDKLHNEARVL